MAAAPESASPWRDPIRSAPALPVCGDGRATRELLGLPVAVTDQRRCSTGSMSASALHARGRAPPGPLATRHVCPPAMWPRCRTGDYICVTAVHSIMTAQELPALKAAIRESSFAVPDGQPVAWGLKALGRASTDASTAPDLMAYQAARAAEKGHRWFLYGGPRRRSDGATAPHRPPAGAPPRPADRGSHRPVFPAAHSRRSRMRSSP